MKSSAHVLIVTLIAIAIVIYLKFSEVYLFGIIIGVILPDLIEPPSSRFHRKFWHSRKLFKAIILLLAFSFLASLLISRDMYWVFFILLGYEIHLFCDYLWSKFH